MSLYLLHILPTNQPTIIHVHFGFLSSLNIMQAIYIHYDIQWQQNDTMLH